MSTRHTTSPGWIEAQVGFGGPPIVIPTPARVLYNYHWPWARGGKNASCMVTEADHKTFLTLSATYSAQGFGENDPSVHSAVVGIAASMLHGLVEMYVDQGCSIISLDQTCAVLRKPRSDWEFGEP